jgi:hypothetical protein
MSDPVLANRKISPTPLGATAQAGKPVESSFGAYLSARKELFAIEAKELAGRLRIRGAGVVAIGVLVVSTYALLIAGLIGWLAALSGPNGLAWYSIALIIAGIQLILAVIIGFLVTRPMPPAFPFTRKELQLDSSWLQSLKTRVKKP